MSHLVKVNAQEPDRQGAISQALSDLSDVGASSPSSGHMLTWSGSAWSSSADTITPSSARGTSGSSSSSSGVGVSTPNPYLGAADPNRLFWEYAALQQGSALRLGVSNTSDASFRSNAYGITRWGVGFNIATTGVYGLRATLHVGYLSAASAYIDASWTDISYNKLGPITRFSTAGNKRNTMRGVIDATAGDVAGVYVDAVSGAYYLQATYVNIFIEMERLS